MNKIREKKILKSNSVLKIYEGRRRMERKGIILSMVLSLFLLNGERGFAQGGFFLGLQAGYHTQKPSLKKVEFDTNTGFLYGVKAGLKLMMFAVEGNYFRVMHNLEPVDSLDLEWGKGEFFLSYLGFNIKYFFPLLFFHPYLSGGYGYYSAELKNVDKDRKGGYNIGLGLELHLTPKLALAAEGRYHRLKLNIDDKELKFGDFSLSTGLNFYF